MWLLSLLLLQTTVGRHPSLAVPQPCPASSPEGLPLLLSTWTPTQQWLCFLFQKEYAVPSEKSQTEKKQTL